MRIAVVVAALFTCPLIAAAEPSADRPQLGLAVNPSIRWVSGDAFAASVYVGFARHHAIRANLASYVDNRAIGTLVSDVFFDGDGDDARRSGGNLDVGVSYLVFPRRLWSGPTLEAGVLVRSIDTRVENPVETPELVETHTNVLAGRALAGWSWLLYDRVFVSFAAGASVGYETGTQTTSISALHPMPETHGVSRKTTAAEGFVRIGGVFDL